MRQKKQIVNARSNLLNNPQLFCQYTWTSTLSVKRNLSLLQSVTHWNPSINMNHIGHRLGKFILNNAHLESTKVPAQVLQSSVSRDKCDEIATGQFSKITETACLSGWEFEADKSRYGVYVTRHWIWNWMNNYWMFWIGRLRGARSVNSFCDFREMTFCDLTAFFSFLTRENLVFFRYSY